MQAGLILIALLLPAADHSVAWSREPVIVDGAATEAVWQAQPAKSWRFAWDRTHLYFFGLDQKLLETGLSLADKTRSVWFLLDSQRNVRWGLSKEATLPSQAAIKATTQGFELAIPWVELSPLGARPDPGLTWNFQVGAGVAAVIRFQSADSSDATGPVPVGLTPWSGSPEPGLPFKTKPAFAEAKLPFPICIALVPNSDTYFVSTEPSPYAQTKLLRFRASNPALAEGILELDGMIYDVAFHPDFAKNRFVYLGTNGKFGGKDPHKTRILRYQVSATEPFALIKDSAQTVIEWESNGHNGGAICFGNDGMLYVTSGDGTSDSDLNLTGQDTKKLLAKVLRIDVDHPDPGKAYAVPKDNPWVGDGKFVPEAWAMGLRNPWRISCDKATGNIWVGNNGQDLWETTYLIRKGENYGWSVLEGTHDFYPERTGGPRPFAKPAAEHHHNEARSLTGGVTYHGKKFPDLAGHYIYGDYSTGKIWALAPPAADAVLPLRPWEIADTAHQITGFGLDQEGELLILDHLTGIHRLERNPMAGKKGSFPIRLSDSGMFASVKDYRLKPGIAPYEVNSPFWSDGALKARHLFIPDRKTSDSQLVPQSATHAGSGPWTFPDGTVIIKSFGLDISPAGASEEAGKPRARWIETRFLVKEDNEWTGYTYSWNDHGTDATLVGPAGENREFTTSTGKQTWRYPSRAECMVCHSRAAGFVLGLCDLQLNRDLTHMGEKKVNQIAWLQAQGRVGQPVGDARLQALRERGKAAKINPEKLEAWIAERSPVGGFRPLSLVFDSDPKALPKLPSPLDAQTGTLEERARAYLHVNCATCHVEAGGGNAKIRLDWAAKLAEMQLIDQKPAHHSFGLENARLIAPGFPERSVLLERIANAGVGKMPPVGKNVIDRDGAKLIEEWIRSMKPLPSEKAPAASR